MANPTPAIPATTETTPATLERIETLTLALTVVGAGLGFALGGSVRAFAILLGGSVGFLNFRLLRILVRFFVRARSGEEITRARKGGLVLLTALKFVGLYGGLWALFARTAIDRVGFLLGFSALVLAIAAQGLRSPQPAEAPLGAQEPPAGPSH